MQRKSLQRSIGRIQQAAGRRQIMKLQTKIDQIVNSGSSGATKYLKLTSLVLNNDGGCLNCNAVKPYLNRYRADFEQWQRERGEHDNN